MLVLKWSKNCIYRSRLYGLGYPRRPSSSRVTLSELNFHFFSFQNSTNRLPSSSSSSYSFEFNLELICRSDFFKKLKLHEQLRRVQFSAFCNSQVQIIPNWTRKTVWSLIDNMNTKKFAWRKCWKIFTAVTFCIGEDFVYSFYTRYHWLRKCPFVFQPIIIQNCDV